jgi:nicotinamide-nucleotide amidase
MPDVRLELLCTGDELLDGSVPDTNSPWFMEQLAPLGLRPLAVTLVGDRREEMARALREAAGRSDVLLVSGGLGPTLDDLTAEVAAEVAGVGLEEHGPTWASIQRRFAERGIALSPNNRKQALVPAGAAVHENPAGTAPCFVLQLGRCTCFFVAGVPREYQALARAVVLPALRARLSLDGSRVFRAARVLKTILLPESHLDARVRPLVPAHPSVRFGTRTRAPENHLKLLAEADSQQEADARLASAERDCREVLGEFLFGADGDRYEEVLVGALRAAQRTVAVAESCTGGRVAAQLTSVPGASDVFAGGAVAYTEAAKQHFARVPAGLIARAGVVSAEVASAMASGIRAACGADFGVGVTGYAGPGGGTAEHPVGTVFAAVAGPGGQVHVRRALLPGDRERVQRLATAHALELLRHAVAVDGL